MSTSSIIYLFLQIFYAEFDIFSQLPEGALDSVKETINGAGNVNIVPIHVVEEVSKVIF